MPNTEYIESRNGGRYVAGSRIGLDVVAHAFRQGRTAEDILRSFPSIGSLAKVYGVLTFILEHPQEIEALLHYNGFRIDEQWGGFDKTPASAEAETLVVHARLRSGFRPG